MSTLLFYIAIGFGILIICSMIPGVTHLVQPLIKLIFALFQFVVENAGAWIIWLTKALMRAHSDLLKNLFLKAEDVDPTLKVRDGSANQVVSLKADIEKKLGFELSGKTIAKQWQAASARVRQGIKDKVAKE